MGAVGWPVLLFSQVLSYSIFASSVGVTSATLSVEAANTYRQHMDASSVGAMFCFLLVIIHYLPSTKVNA